MRALLRSLLLFDSNIPAVIRLSSPPRGLGVAMMEDEVDGGERRVLMANGHVATCSRTALAEK